MTNEKNTNDVSCTCEIAWTGMNARCKACHPKNSVTRFSKLKPSAPIFPKYASGEITSAYVMNDGCVVGYCATTREWLKWDKRGRLNVSCGKTREDAAILFGDDDAHWIDSQYQDAITPEPADAPILIRVPSEATNARAEAEAYLANRFRPRYINLAAFTDTASTISAQCWVQSTSDLQEAEHRLLKWASPSEEKWHGRVVRAIMFDTHTKELRHFVCDDTCLLKEARD
jgi:hypothetical protein